MQSRYNGVYIPGACYHAARSQSSSLASGAGVIVSSFRNPTNSGKVIAIRILRFGLTVGANVGTSMLGVYARVCRNYSVEDTGGSLSVNTRLCSEDALGIAQFRMNESGFLTAGTRDTPENAVLLGEAQSVKAGDLITIKGDRVFDNHPLIILPNEGFEFVNSRSIPDGTTVSFGIEIEWNEITESEWEKIKG